MTERRESIARAIHAESELDFDLPNRWTWEEAGDLGRSFYRRLADAAIAADGLQARVLALAEELEGWRDNARRYEANALTNGAREIADQSRARGLAYDRALDRLRDLLDGADRSEATT